MNNFIDIDKCTSAIIQTLRAAGIYDWLKSQPSMYIGGSLVSYLMCHDHIMSEKITHDDNTIPHDIDMYTTNHISSINNFNQNIDHFIVDGIQGCIINFSCVNHSNNLHLQFITAEVDNFYDDVLGNYDCDLVCVGYHPFDDTLILHHRYVNACKTHVFNCYKHLSSVSRGDKLNTRAKLWYGGTLKFIGGEFGRIDAYYDCQNSDLSKSITNIITPPKYIQLFYNLYKCVKCGIQNKKLLCTICSSKILSSHNANKLIHSAIVIGGCNGLGKIIGDTFTSNNLDVTRTSRFPNSESDMKFILGTDISCELMEKINSTQILVMNATKTLDNNESVWNHYIDDFDISLLYDRIDTNVCSYVKFIKQLCEYRIQLIESEKSLNKLVLIYTDANESKFEGKMCDCKHLELNIAKSGVKQIFYTNAPLLAKLNIIVVCYDPGWLSYHGISIEKKRAKSVDLIPPVISSLGILDIATTTYNNFEKLLLSKSVIFDHDVYKFINK